MTRTKRGPGRGTRPRALRTNLENDPAVLQRARLGERHRCVSVRPCHRRLKTKNEIDRSDAAQWVASSRRLIEPRIGTRSISDAGARSALVWPFAWPANNGQSGGVRAARASGEGAPASRLASRIDVPESEARGGGTATTPEWS